MPEQFKSDVSTVILGLDKDPELKNVTLTADHVKSAAHKLLRKYHPDLYQDPNDKKVAEEITKSINNARDKLDAYIKNDSNYNPFGHSETYAQEDSTSSKYSNNSGYNWDDLFNERRPPRHEQEDRDSRGIVTQDYYGGTSMISTMFEFLSRYANFQQAYVSWDYESVEMTQMDVIMVIDKNLFPNIELRYISKSKDGSAPQLVKSTWGKYVRGHHQRSSSDAIVFGDGPIY